MQKRVALARTIVLEPRIVVYDEPTTGLDPLTSDTISELVRRLQSERGITSIVVTHDVRCAFHVADRVAMIDQGRVLVEGTLEEIKQSPVQKLRAFLYG
jgi:phospholipid/cholesterol/gamma-HCH transport system ATP-binding protein